VLLFVHRGDAPAPIAAERARIDATSAADFERQITQTAAGVDEVVRVRSGTISLSIGELAPHEHVRVATGDAQIDGRGSYRVRVEHDALREVTVVAGSATLRVTGHDAVFLATGQTWRATVVTADVVPAPSTGEHAPTATPDPSAAPTHVATSSVASTQVAADASAAKHVATSSAAPAQDAGAPDASPDTAAHVEVTAPDAQPKLTNTTELEKHFAAGLALLKANKPAEAARELAAAIAANDADPLAADARYFEAIALTRAGRKTEAEAALLGFLDHAPSSLRRGRAAVMLARLIAERGDAAAARRWFESALSDPDANVAAAARAGIAALH
jgi:TolA-binding protein